MEGETLYSYVIGMLRDLVVKEMVYLQSFAPAIDDLQQKLTKMEELLEYADVRRHKCTAEIIGMADLLISQIEKYIFRVESKHTGFMGIKNRFLHQKFHLEIKKITSKLNGFIDSQSGVRDVDSSDSDLRGPYTVQDLSGFGFAEKEFVGREKDITNLVDYLVDEEKEDFQIISIYGTGGLGKTTLARKVYRDKRVLSHFNKLAFVCVTQQCHAGELLKHILQQLAPQDGDEAVIECLRRVLREEKCLVVIDDIWSVSDWESLHLGLPIESTGSKVLLTTRKKEVADKGFNCSLERLSEEDSWELFRKKITLGGGFFGDQQEEQYMVEWGREMIASCGGSPLAVKALRGTLVTKGNFRKWKRFYEKGDWKGELYETNDEVVKYLSFSYTDLPYPLKSCFLYLAHLAEDEEINVEELYTLWDGEGLILSKDRKVGETNIDVAKRYLSELVGRSMVEAEVTEGVSNGWGSFKSCRLHDLMRALCHSIAKKENFLTFNDYSSHKDELVVLNSSLFANKTKIPSRQVLYFSKQQVVVIDNKLKANQHVRSLMLVNGNGRKLSNLKKLKFLRVLTIYDTDDLQTEVINDLETEVINWNIGFINELLHLRCLHLSRIRVLPSSVDNLIYLQTLDLRNMETVTIPNTFLRKLKRLKHLLLPYDDWRYKVTPELSRLRIDGLTELETLVNVYPRKWEMNDVIQLTNLKRVECKFEIWSEEDGKMLKEFMEKLKLDASGYSLYRISVLNPEIEVYWDILRGKLLEYRKENIYEMDIWNFSRYLLPEFSNYNLLIDLRLISCSFEEDPMPILEKLSNLKVLYFLDGELYLLDGELKGKEMVCSAMGFPKLTHLDFMYLRNWEKWTVEEGALPNLHQISIGGCDDLKKLPSGLKFITTLEQLYLEDMSEEFRRRLKGEGGEEGPDFHIIRHVRDVRIP